MAKRNVTKKKKAHSKTRIGFLHVTDCVRVKPCICFISALEWKLTPRNSSAVTLHSSFTVVLHVKGHILCSLGGNEAVSGAGAAPVSNS